VVDNSPSPDNAGSKSALPRSGSPSRARPSPIASSNRELPEPAPFRNSDTPRERVPITGGINSHLQDDLHPSAMCRKS
jgi:hypothetical protein